MNTPMRGIRAIKLPLIVALLVTVVGVAPSHAVDGVWKSGSYGCKVRINRIHLATSRPGVKVSGDGKCSVPVDKMALYTFLYFCNNTEPVNNTIWLQNNCTHKGSNGLGISTPTVGRVYTVSAPAPSFPDAHGNGWWGAYSAISVWPVDGPVFENVYVFATHRRIDG